MTSPRPFLRLPAFPAAFLSAACLLAASVLAAGLPAAAQSTASMSQRATQQKLASLKELHDAGILSDGEYQQKVAALNANTGTPANSQPARAAAAAPPTKSKSLGEPTVAHILNDPAWGIPWGTIKLPAGWGFNGGVVHGGNCIVFGDEPMWIAESPDKNVGIALLPILKAGWVSDQRQLAQMRQAGCPILHSTRAADYLTQVVLPHLHKNFKVVGTAPEPMFEPMANQMRQMNAQSGQIQNQFSQARDTVDTARVVITYEEAGALRVEMASAELSCHEMMMRGMGQMPGSDTLDCTSYQTVIVHAPDDGTPIASLATMDMSKSTEKPFFLVEQNPAWQRHFQEVSQQKSQQMQAQNTSNNNSSQSMMKDNQDAFAKQQAIRQGVRDYSAKVHNDVYQNQQRANTQVTGAYAAHMGDYNVYTNQSTGQQYQMSNQYNNSYVNQNGTVGLQTNSANSPGVDWQQLTPKY